MAMRRTLVLFSVLAVSAGAARAEDGPLVPHFIDETRQAGIDSTYTGEWEYMVGGGVAAFDCNGDGFDDLLLPGGAVPAKFYQNRSSHGSPLSFEQSRSGLELDAVTGAYPLDIDGDGHLDVVLLRSGENVAMRGLGGCRFERANKAWGFEGGDGWSTALAATWEKGASFPTIAIGNYIDRYEDLHPWGSCTDNWLHRPAADGTRRFGPPMPLKPSYCPLSMLFTDWNRSGTPALRVSNDREYYKGGEEQLWHVEPGRDPALYTHQEGWKTLKIWGMGIASTDLNGDGFPEYFLTSMADNKLQTLAKVDPEGTPQPVYRDVALAKGVTAHRPYTGGETRPSTAWHAQFADVNNDGRADLFVAKGNVSKMPDFALKDPNNLLLQKGDGTFLESGDKAGVASMLSGRGAALVDLNLDGLLDLVVVNQSGPAELWRNATERAGHFVEIRLSQDGANRDAVGSWIEIRRGDTVQRREVTVGGGHASGISGWHHFGLGDATSADIRILWPDGGTGDWQAIKADGFYSAIKGKDGAADRIEAWTSTPTR
ncbi:Repeat domain-containing protein [Rhizobium sp. RU20A]|uniref:CRTAC1 family protein n=1 Tax=Rhizobium sp. RU20A TaxID=1907412 RepID=UPI000954ED6C|nr:CRTAC1 family protein [Rhizobium sp. RU20A]SIQ61371.1 Repeat domain-containing protein [Rhizobium sp. RU20A]